ncbi:fungal-specific transcription factor domain-containing protein [Exophiala viscosa]|uniref:fungal-specific transcription factor domain-containing protein n=1 Tax=Exophiala viscosa TaxID=2486360 RepID=UPI00218D91F2|nr:fungal-specific transcription factor domain-containing protein [Exophiala viscosa]
MHRSGEKRISCKRCQTRKIKCSRTTPCRSCAAAGVKCEFRVDDWKRFPISAEYVSALERRATTLELLLSSIKSSSGFERDAIIEGIDLDDHLPLTDASNQAGPRSQFTLDMNESVNQSLDDSWMSDEHGVPVFHGLGSAYSTGLVRPRRSWQKLRSIPNEKMSTVPRVVFRECIQLFFDWQIPYSTLVDRNAFMHDWSSGSESGSDFSPPLLHAICALGALMSQDQNIRALADLFAAAANDELSVESCWVPRLATCQALLLCAVFNLGHGDSSKAWMNSGLAFRMAQDLGINRQLGRYSSTCQTGTSLDDLESRRRMSLTFAISDKMFSLFFGRSPTLEEEDFDTDLDSVACGSGNPSLTPESDLASSKGPYTSSWLNQTSSVAGGLPEMDQSFVSTVLLVKQAELSNIIADMQRQILSTRRRLLYRPDHWYDALYNKLNARLWRWHDSLPGELRWNRWSSNLEMVDPSLSPLHMLFQTTRLILNKSILTRYKHKALSFQNPPDIIMEALRLCDASIETIVGIIRRFGAQHSLQNAPFVFVHGAIVAADVTLSLSSWRRADGGGEHSPRIPDPDTVLPVLESTLADLSSAWSIAHDARNELRKVMDQLSSSPQMNDLWIPPTGPPGGDGAHTALTHISDSTVSTTFPSTYPSTSGFDFSFSESGTGSMAADTGQFRQSGIAQMNFDATASVGLNHMATNELGATGELLDATIFPFEISQHVYGQNGQAIY